VGAVVVAAGRVDSRLRVLVVAFELEGGDEVVAGTAAWAVAEVVVVETDVAAWAVAGLVGLEVAAFGAH
jgi:hypothetical protein